MNRHGSWSQHFSTGQCTFTTPCKCPFFSLLPRSYENIPLTANDNIHWCISCSHEAGTSKVCMDSVMLNVCSGRVVYPRRLMWNFSPPVYSTTWSLLGPAACGSVQGPPLPFPVDLDRCTLGADMVSPLLLVLGSADRPRPRPRPRRDGVLTLPPRDPGPRAGPGG